MTVSLSVWTREAEWVSICPGTAEEATNEFARYANDDLEIS